MRDPLSGYFACRRGLLAGPLRAQPRGYKVLLALLLSRPGLRVLELPTTFRDRSSGSSKLGLRQKLEFLGQVAEQIIRQLLPARSLPLKPPIPRRILP